MNGKDRLLAVVLTLAFLLPAGRVQAAVPGSVPAPSQQSQAVGERPFDLPFAAPSGPGTWLLGQPYGNTTGAYYRRFSVYGASGGIHFGIDLSAPCRTEILAIADGVVFAVDGPFGAPPHNLVIDHPQLGYASMYGHLIEAPDLRPGQAVKQGEVVALVGDSAGVCYRRPHLHLEIRDLNHVVKYDPTTLIDADWNSLALVGGSSLNFMHDLAEPRKWQSLYDQPQARIAGPILNDFQSTWPFDWSKPEHNPPQSVELQPTPIQAGDATSSVLRSSAIGRQVTGGNCCTQPYWSPDSSQILFVDRPQPEATVGVWGVDVSAPGQAQPQLVEGRLGIYSPNGQLIAYPDHGNGLAVVERLADGHLSRIDTQENEIDFTPDSRHIYWVVASDDEIQSVERESLWLADLDGNDARAVFTAYRVSAVGWLNEDELLLIEGLADTSDERLVKFSLQDETVTEILEGPRMRGPALSPQRQRLAYYVRFEVEPDKNGVWVVDLQDPSSGPVKMPFFGSYRWRDESRLIYVAFDPNAATHDFYEYDLASGQSRSLFPDGTQLAIANNDWQVSPDGKHIALLAARNWALDGIWLLDVN